MNSTNIAQFIGLTLWALSIGFLLQNHLISNNTQRFIKIGTWVALLPLAFLARGLLADLAITTPLLALWISRKTHLNRIYLRALTILMLTGLFLSISALGFTGAFDLYSLGYPSLFSVPALALLLILAWFFTPTLAIVWLGGLLLLALNFLPSNNVWDVFIDIPGCMMAAYLVTSGWRRAQPATLMRA